jgi:DnaJ-class molecular chaperone
VLPEVALSSREVACTRCAGSGLATPTWWPQRLTRLLRPITKCRDCKGSGRVPNDIAEAARRLLQQP